ncbi:hypothetical protein [Dyadobacter sp. 32]|uniref:hypothetical protein n=1 Tax=Dyadobacter sp. 32 TaxID=538966 RepID=UPI0011F0698D
MLHLDRQAVKLLAFVVPSLLLAFFSIHNLDYFGLDYDELIFVNAALGDLDGKTFIHLKWHGLVLMVYSYIGALKSWLYIPIIKLFGVNPWSVRIPVVLILYVNVYLSYKVALGYFSRYVAYAVFLILSVDLTFITLQRFDKGPSAIETLVKLGILILLLRPETVKKQFLLVALVLIGIYNKVNFIWIVNALYGVCFLMHWTDIKEVIQRNISLQAFFRSIIFRYTVLYLCIVICYVAFILALEIHPSPLPSTIKELGEVIVFQVKMVKYTLINTRVFFWFGWNYQNNLLQLAGNLLFPGIILINLFIYWTRRVSFRSFHTAFGLYIVLIFIQIVVTVNATNAWHTFVLYPALHIFILHSFYLLFQPFSGVKKLSFVTIAGLLTVVNIYNQYQFWLKSKHECVTGELFIPEMSTLISYTQKRPERTIISTAWGLHSPLLLSDKKNKTYFESIFLPYPTGYEKWYQENVKTLKSSGQILLVDCVLEKTPMYGHNYNVRDNYRFRLLNEFLNTKKQNAYLIAVIRNKCGEPVYNIYKLHDI